MVFLQASMLRDTGTDLQARQPCNLPPVTSPRHGYQPETQVPVPDEARRYVASVSLWQEGATLDLTPEGLAFGRTNAGAEALAGITRTLDGWSGTRTQSDLAREIKDHCVAWRWLPPLRGRANPIDLEFYMPWPQNLLLSMLSVLRRCLGRVRASG